jgi:hypothetical protein
MNADDIKAAFKGGHTDYLGAIVALQSRGFDAKDAEAMVIAWEQEPAKSWLDVLPDIPMSKPDF